MELHFLSGVFVSITIMKYPRYAKFHIQSVVIAACTCMFFFFHHFPTPSLEHLPQQRALSKDVKAKATKLLEMKANKKLIQRQITEETGKIILLKDLTNISSAMKDGKSRNDLDSTIAMLKDKYGKYNIIVDRTCLQ